MKKIFVDTNVLIDYSHGVLNLLAPLLSKQQAKKLDLYINPIVVAEFMTDKKLANSSLQSKAEDFLSFFTIIPITQKMGILAGKLLREEQSEYLGDSLISAACLIESMALLTRNTKHFKKVVGLKMYTLKKTNLQIGKF